MTREELTDRQRERIQRWFDGELDPAERADIEELIEENPAAREYADRLREVRRATTIAHNEVTDAADGILDPDAIVEAATEAPPPEQQPLREVAPLVERYYDGEALDAERQVVERLLDRRDDVADYLDAVEELGDSVRAAEREAKSGVDFDALRDDLIDRLERDRELDPVLLHRFADGELDDEERVRVEQWMEADPEARATVSAIEELGDAARAAVDEVRERAELDDFWSELEGRLDDEESATGEDAGTVVPFDADRESADTSPDSGDSVEASSTGSNRVVELFSEYRSHFMGAAAAAVVLVAAAALLRPGLFQGQNERVVVKEKKTVVIVDSVEYSQGSSVVVDSPMKQVRAQSESSDNQESKEGENSTVIWLLDSGEQDGDSKDDDSETPGSDDKPPSDGEDTDSQDSRDAGETDAEPPPSGKPI